MKTIRKLLGLIERWSERVEREWRNKTYGQWRDEQW